jgi:2-methylcitrate dehydratase
MDDTTQALARYASELCYGDLPHDVVHETKRKLIDTIGCAIGAFTEEPCRLARAMARRCVGNPPARILGTQEMSTPEHAAFANGVMVRVQDYNDSYLSKGSCHPSDTLSGVLAIADALGLNGKAVVTASVLAYEVTCNFADMLAREQGIDNTFFGVIGSAVAGANLLGLTKEATEDAIALAITPNVTLAQTRLGELSMWKGCAAANGVRNGVFAAFAAQIGLTGPDAPIDGAWGLKRVLGDFQWAPFGGRGAPFRITQTHIKFYPAVVHGQSPIGAALNLRDKVDLRSIDSIHLDTYWVAERYLDRASPLWRPTTRETADHSLPYLVAAALLDGDITEATFAPERISDPALLELMAKIQVREDAQLTAAYPEGWGCRLEIANGSRTNHVAEVKYFKGHARAPLSDAEVESKFCRLVEPRLGQEETRALLRALWRLEESSDVRTILGLVKVGQLDCDELIS